MQNQRLSQAHAVEVAHLLNAKIPRSSMVVCLDLPNNNFSHPFKCAFMHNSNYCKPQEFLSFNGLAGVIIACGCMLSEGLVGLLLFLNQYLCHWLFQFTLTKNNFFGLRR